MQPKGRGNHAKGPQFVSAMSASEVGAEEQAEEEELEEGCCPSVPSAVAKELVDLEVPVATTKTLS